LLDLGVINNSDSIKLKNNFSGLLNEQFNFGLTHGDLSLANMIVEKTKVSLIDWGSAEITIVPHFEIMGIFEDSLKESDPLFNNFLSGYGMSWEELSRLKPEITVLRLLRTIDKLRWAIDRKPEMIQNFSEKVKKLVSEFI